MKEQPRKYIFFLIFLKIFTPGVGEDTLVPVHSQPGRISQQLALDRSGRDTAELQPRTRVSADQERRGPRLRRHQVVYRHGNSHDVVLVWSVISEIISQLI